MTKFLKIFILLLYVLSPTSTYSIDQLNFKNLSIHNNPKKLEKIEFKNFKNETIKLSDFESKLIILNFWATWCFPCREEMPSLDRLMVNKEFKNLEIIAINVGRESISKSKKFYNDINIQNLAIYYDDTLHLPKKLLLRGIPTTLLINKNGEEFARILGEINFADKKFIEWLKKYD